MARLGAFVLLLLAAAAARAADDAAAALARLGSPDPKRRCEAVAVLEGVREEALRDAVLQGLVARLDDPSPPVRSRAALALGRRGDARAAEPIARRLEGEPRRDVLPSFLLALGDLRASAEVGTVVSFATTSPAPAVRGAALTALGRIGGERARTVLLEALARPGLADSDWALRSAAMLGLAHAGRAEDVGKVLVIYREGGGAAHWFARSALARFVAERDPDPLPVLHRLVGDADPRVALTAAEGFARSGHQDALLGLLAHVVPSVRAAAAGAIAKARVEAGYPRLRTMARFDRSREVRWAAALALFRAEDPEGDALVLDGLRSREPAVWAEALAALAERTGESHGRDTEAWRAALWRWRTRR